MSAEYIRITVPSLVGKSPVDQRLGKVLFTNGVSKPQYANSATGLNYLKYLDNLGVAYTYAPVTLDSNGNEVQQ